MLSAFVGLMFAAAGLWGMAHWRGELGLFLRGFVPLSFFLGGLVAAMVGFFAMRGNRIPDKKQGDKP